VDAASLVPEDHLRMQAALQPWVDNAISKTVTIPVDYDFDAFAAVYRQAYELGLKGCTVYRPNPVTGEVLAAARPAAAHCCSLEREAD
jgi:ribonucleoside-diphosphate reductase alpha chain